MGGSIQTMESKSRVNLSISGGHHVTRRESLGPPIGTVAHSIRLDRSFTNSRGEGKNHDGGFRRVGSFATVESSPCKTVLLQFGEWLNRAASGWRNSKAAQVDTASPLRCELKSRLPKTDLTAALSHQRDLDCAKNGTHNRGRAAEPRGKAMINQRIEKACLSILNKVSRKYKLTRPYYWSELRLYPLRAVIVMPMWWHRTLYSIGMSMVEFKRLERMSDRLIHKIPYRIRFQLG